MRIAILHPQRPLNGILPGFYPSDTLSCRESTFPRHGFSFSSTQRPRPKCTSPLNRRARSRVDVPETFPFSLSGTASTVRGRRSETGIPFRATVRPPVSSNDHYEGSTRQRPVTNYILLAQSRPARTHTMRALPRERRYSTRTRHARARALVRHGPRRPLAKVQISRQIKSFSPAILLAGVPPTFSLESIHRTDRRRGLPSLLAPPHHRPRSGRGGTPREIERTREGPRDLSGILLHARRDPENAARRLPAITRSARARCYQNIDSDR